MTMKLPVILVVAGLAVAGCTDPNRVGGKDGFGSGNPTGGSAPAVVPGSANDPTSVAYFQQTVGDRVLFAVDQSTLTPQGQATLNQQASWLMANPAYTAVIEGHADEQGTRQYNLALGARRANAAREYLVSKGVPAGRLNVVSYGKERPLEICSNEACYAKNRRAVTVLAGGVTG